MRNTCTMLLCTSIGIMIISTLACSRTSSNTRLHEQGSQQTCNSAQISPSAQQLAEGLTHRLGDAPFVGTISFDATYTPGSKTEPTVEQHGSMHFGANGEIRLDLYSPSSPLPSVCCVDRGRAWVIWGGTSRFIHEGPYLQDPKNFDELPAFFQQLIYQAEQTVGWANEFLNTDSLRYNEIRIRNAELTSDSLVADVTASESSSEPTRAFQLEAVFSEEFDRYLPFEFRNRHGCKRMSSYVAVDGYRPLPTMIESITSSGVSTWTVTSITPVNVADEHDEFAARFLVPTNGKSAMGFEGLCGRMTYDAAGKERFSGF